MRICHVAHGIYSIPPYGWGSTEALIWDYKFHCEEAGHEFFVINTKDEAAMVAQVNRLAPDLVHLHCELHFRRVSELKAKVRIIASRWPTFYEEKHAASARKLLANEARVACVSEAVRQRCREFGVAEDRLFVVRNGARPDLIHFRATPDFPTRALCLAAIVPRKRQHLLADIPEVYFAGPIRHESGGAFERHPRYHGEWQRAQVGRELGDYSALVLLSEAETAPLVTCEALMAGLGLVVSEAAAANLDRTRPFIRVVPEDRVGDPEYVREAIRSVQAIALGMRAEIRRHAEEHFDLAVRIQEYLTLGEGWLAAAGRS